MRQASAPAQYRDGGVVRRAHSSDRAPRLLYHSSGAFLSTVLFCDVVKISDSIKCLDKRWMDFLFTIGKLKILSL